MSVKDEYKKERKRIQNFIRRAEKRGYQFNYNVPPIPKKITKSSVSRLKKVTPKYLYERAVYGGQATYGEIVTGKKGRFAERKASALKAKETRQHRKEQRKEIERKRKEKEQLEQNYYTSIVDTIKDYVLGLPSIKAVRLQSGTFGFYNVDPHKSFLLSKFNDKLDEADANSYYKNYIEYLYQNEEEIINALKPITYASSQEQIVVSFNLALQLLVQRIQTAEESKRLEEEYNQYFESR